MWCCFGEECGGGGQAEQILQTLLLVKNMLEPLESLFGAAGCLQDELGGGMGWKQPARASLEWSVSAAGRMNISVRPKPGKKQ